jgi:hypothetical protein
MSLPLDFSVTSRQSLGLIRRFVYQQTDGRAWNIKPALFENECFCRNSDHCAMGRSFFQNNGSGTDDCLDPNGGIRQQHRPNADMRETLYHDSSAQYGTRRDVDVLIDSAVMLDDCSSVQNAVVADHGTGVYDNSGHHQRPSADDRRSGDRSCRMHKRGRNEPVSQSTIKTTPA